MGILDNGLRGNLATLGIGVGIAFLTPIVLPILAGIVRPIAKGVLKGGYILYEKGREMSAEMGESIEDLVSEAKSELAEKGYKVDKKTPPAPKTKTATQKGAA